MKKIISFLIFLVSMDVYSSDWELKEKGINYEKAQIEGKLATQTEQEKINIYILDNFSGTPSHGYKISTLFRKIAPHTNINEVDISLLSYPITPVITSSIEEITNTINENQYNIINLSLTTYNESSIGTEIVTVINNFLNKSEKNYMVVASGNDNADFFNKYCESTNSRLLCVSATNKNEAKANYSNYGLHVDLAAPGGESNYTSKIELIKSLNLEYKNEKLYEEVKGKQYELNIAHENSKNTNLSNYEDFLITNQTTGERFSTKEWLLNIAKDIVEKDLYAELDINFLEDYIFYDLLNYNKVELVEDRSFIELFQYLENSSQSTDSKIKIGNTEDKGTSLAAPIVAASLSHVLAKQTSLQENQLLTSNQIIENLIYNGDYIATFDNIYSCNFTIIKYDNYTCNGYKIKSPRKINLYESLKNLTNLKPTTIKTTGESNKISDINSTREWNSERKDILENSSERWGDYRKPINTDVFEIDHILEIDQNVNAKNIIIKENSIVTFKNNPIVDVGNYFENRGTIKGCFSDSCPYIGSLNLTANASLFKNNGILDLDSFGFGFYEGSGIININNSCNGDIINKQGTINVFHNQKNCNIQSKIVNFQPKPTNISINDVLQYSASGNHYLENSMVILNKPETTLSNYYLTFFNSYKTFLKYNIEIEGRFASKYFDTDNSIKYINISNVEGFNNELNEWINNSIYFEEANIINTNINSYFGNNIEAKKLTLKNSTINGSPNLMVNSFNSYGSVLNLNNLEIRKSPNIPFELNNSSELNISDSLVLNGLGEINISTLMKNINNNINNLEIKNGTYLKIDIGVNLNNITIDENSNVEILANKTLNIESVQNITQVNELSENPLIYGDGFLGINNFVCGNNAIHDLGDVNVSFYNTKFTTSYYNCTVLGKKVDFKNFLSSRTSGTINHTTDPYGTIKIGNTTKSTDLIFNSDFNHPNVTFNILNGNANINSNEVSLKDLYITTGNLFNNGNLNISTLYSENATYYYGNKPNNTGYIRFTNPIVNFTDEIEVYKPYFVTNADITISNNVILEDLVQNILLEGDSILTLKGLCRTKIDYLNGTINLEEIKLNDYVNSYYTRSSPCEIDANTVNINSFDNTFVQKDLNGTINNLNIYANTIGTNYIQLKLIGNLNIYGDVTLSNSTAYGSEVTGDINNYNILNLSSIIHRDGIINNSGNMSISSITTNRLGNHQGNKINITKSSIAGMGNVIVESEGEIDNLYGTVNDKVIMDYPFTFNNSKVFKFEGNEKVTLTGLCSGHYTYENGIVELKDIQMKVHQPNSYYSPSHGCEITATDIDLISVDSSYDQRNLLAHGNLNILTNSSDYFGLNMDNGILNIVSGADVTLLTNSDLNSYLLIIESGARLHSTGTIKTFNSDILIDGMLDVKVFSSNRLGHVNENGIFNIERYLIPEQASTIITESEGKVELLQIHPNNNITMNDPFEFESPIGFLDLTGSKVATISKLCEIAINYEGGTIDLKNIQFHQENHGYGHYDDPCEIYTSTININSFDGGYNQRDLISTGILNINANYTGGDYLRFRHAGIFNNNANINVWYLSTLSNVTNNGVLSIQLGNYTYNGTLINNGHISVDTNRTFRMNGVLSPRGSWSVGECLYYENGIKYESPNDLVECEE